MSETTVVFCFLGAVVLTTVHFLCLAIRQARRLTIAELLGAIALMGVGLSLMRSRLTPKTVFLFGIAFLYVVPLFLLLHVPYRIVRIILMTLWFALAFIGILAFFQIP